MRISSHWAAHIFGLFTIVIFLLTCSTRDVSKSGAEDSVSDSNRQPPAATRQISVNSAIIEGILTARDSGAGYTIVIKALKGSGAGTPESFCPLDRVRPGTLGARRMPDAVEVGSPKQESPSSGDKRSGGRQMENT